MCELVNLPEAFGGCLRILETVGMQTREQEAAMQSRCGLPPVRSVCLPYDDDDDDDDDNDDADDDDANDDADDDAAADDDDHYNDRC